MIGAVYNPAPPAAFSLNYTAIEYDIQHQPSSRKRDLASQVPSDFSKSGAIAARNGSIRGEYHSVVEAAPHALLFFSYG